MLKNISTLVLITFEVVLATLEGQFLLSCNSDDLPCLQKSTHFFLDKTKHGIKIANLQPIDPLFLKSSTYPGLLPVQPGFNFSNVTVLGLKDMELIDFKMDMNAKSVEFSTRAHVNVTGEVSVLMAMKPFPYIESFTSTAHTLVKVKYNYDLKRLIIFKHFVIGPEELDCKVLPALKQNSRTGLLRPSKDTGANNLGIVVPGKALCAVIKDAYKVVIQNIREITKILPATAFISNIH